MVSCQYSVFRGPFSVLVKHLIPLLTADSITYRAGTDDGERRTENEKLMFTLEESALLSRMLRFLGWTLICLALGIAAYFVLT